MTHAELVKRAGRWLRKSQGCSVVLTELVAFTTTGEQPDAIGFLGGGVSIMVECKTSMADFRQDAKKNFRILPDKGVGDYRFYMCAPDILKVEDMPEGWGLLYAGEKRTTRQVGVDPRKCEMKPWKFGPVPFKGYKKNEVVLCVSALRRVGAKTVSEACHPQAAPDSEGNEK